MPRIIIKAVETCRVETTYIVTDAATIEEALERCKSGDIAPEDYRLCGEPSISWDETVSAETDEQHSVEIRISPEKLNLVMWYAGDPRPNRSEFESWDAIQEHLRRNPFTGDAEVWMHSLESGSDGPAILPVTLAKWIAGEPDGSDGEWQFLVPERLLRVLVPSLTTLNYIVEAGQHTRASR